ncbi:WxL protein peptidoglycan domain-containing protein [Glutamicibacter arilaitensis]|uniref:DUF916 domain-containing protein n=1 Tax=Glutamicibacter arilaitensis TaxID=256701 RepID=A0A4Y8TTL8_9MICC|nr:DUF916 domain-containing protein [Glutamicibacter arilaitensis]TFH54575.1 DUF916 domain-containing protein [Glutamicibacter arilaitensis]
MVRAATISADHIPEEKMFQQYATRKNLRHRATISVLAVAIATALTAPAAHGDDLSWGTNPGGTETRSSFAYDLEPGEQARDSFEITNYGTEEISLAVYPADGATTSNGSLELSERTDLATAVGAWIEVDQAEVALGPGEKTSVEFTVEIPTDAAPGDYLGGMVSSYIDTSAGTVVVDRRLATQLAVRVGGEGAVKLNVSAASAQAPIAWNPFEPVDAIVGATVANEGNLRARGSYTITASGPFGWGSTSSEYQLDELLPGSIVAIEQQLPGLWPLLWQQVEVRVNAEDIDSLPAGFSTASTTFWSIPAGWILLLVAVIAASILLGVRRSRRWEADDELEEPVAVESN